MKIVSSPFLSWALLIFGFAIIIYWVIQYDCGEIWQLCTKMYVASLSSFTYVNTPEHKTLSVLNKNKNVTWY
jgi:hypothetical protein